GIRRIDDDVGDLLGVAESHEGPALAAVGRLPHAVAVRDVAADRILAAADAAIAPIVPPKYLSVTGAHDSPALIDLKTPPPGVPIQNSFGRDGLPVAATERPPRYGPISRQWTPVRLSESCAWRRAGSARAGSSRRGKRTGSNHRV